VQRDSCDQDMVHDAVAVGVVIAGRCASIDLPGWSCKVGMHSAGKLVSKDDGVSEWLGKPRQDRSGKAGYRHSIRYTTNPPNVSR